MQTNELLGGAYPHTPPLVSHALHLVSMMLLSNTPFTYFNATPYSHCDGSVGYFPIDATDAYPSHLSARKSNSPLPFRFAGEYTQQVFVGGNNCRPSETTAGQV